MKQLYWEVEEEWKGERCFILGGGPSLTADQINYVRGKGRVIAINDAYKLARWADILYFCDNHPWWTENGADAAKTFRGQIVTLSESPSSRVLALRKGPQKGLETKDRTTLRHGSNSGYQAIHLAYYLGASPIVLLGYDMKVARKAKQPLNQGRTHWFGNRRNQSPKSLESTMQNIWIPCLNELASLLRQQGVEVLNASADTALECFPRVDLRSIV